jgi:hypothetical protein
MLRARISSLTSIAGYRTAALPALSVKRHNSALHATFENANADTPADRPSPLQRYTKSQLMKFKKAQLQEMLSAVQLSSKGNKPELVEMLLNCFPKAASSSRPQSKSSSSVSANVSPPLSELQKQTAVSDFGSRDLPQRASRSTQRNGSTNSGQLVHDLRATPAHANSMPVQFNSTSTAAKGASTLSRNIVQRGCVLGRPPVGPRTQERASSSAASAPQTMQADVPECTLRTGMAVQWLGTSSGAPTQHRNVSSILLLQRRQVLMVDCGEGTVNQLATAGIDVALIGGCAILNCWCPSPSLWSCTHTISGGICTEFACVLAIDMQLALLK